MAMFVMTKPGAFTKTWGFFSSQMGMFYMMIKLDCKTLMFKYQIKISSKLYALSKDWAAVKLLLLSPIDCKYVFFYICKLEPHSEITVYNSQ